jgi:hypothetical protein
MRDSRDILYNNNSFSFKKDRPLSVKPITPKLSHTISFAFLNWSNVYLVVCTDILSALANLSSEILRNTSLLKGSSMRDMRCSILIDKVSKLIFSCEG